MRCKNLSGGNPVAHMSRKALCLSVLALDEQCTLWGLCVHPTHPTPHHCISPLPCIQSYPFGCVSLACMSRQFLCPVL